MKATALVNLRQDGNRLYLNSKETDMFFETNTLEDGSREFSVYHKGEVWLTCPYDDTETRTELFGRAIQRFIKETL